MKRLLQGIVLAAAVVMSWLVLLIVAWPVHALVFVGVPADGPVAAHERRELDQRLTSYLVTGNEQELNPFQPIEVIHMRDVRQLWLWLVVMTTIAVLAARVVHAWHGVRAALLLTAGVAVATLISFQRSFLWLHETIFANNSWLLDPEQFLLTQLYPLHFFVWMWGIIGSLALLTLVAVWQRTRRAQHD